MLSISATLNFLILKISYITKIPDLIVPVRRGFSFLYSGIAIFMKENTIHLDFTKC